MATFAWRRSLGTAQRIPPTGSGEFGYTASVWGHLRAGGQCKATVYHAKPKMTEFAKAQMFASRKSIGSASGARVVAQDVQTQRLLFQPPLKSTTLGGGAE